MAGDTYSFQSTVWEHTGSSAWHFISLPEADTDDIDERFGHRAVGFGSHTSNRKCCKAHDRSGSSNDA
jgi:hypothetical protein